jgi:hypothetical protein
LNLLALLLRWQPLPCDVFSSDVALKPQLLLAGDIKGCDFHIKAATCHSNIINEVKLADGRHFLSVAASSYFLRLPLGAFGLAAIRLIRSLTAVIAVCHHDQAQRLPDRTRVNLTPYKTHFHCGQRWPSVTAEWAAGRRPPLTLVTHKHQTDDLFGGNWGRLATLMMANTHSRFLFTMSRVCG